MKILHCCLSCFYIDNYNYQENILPKQNKADGHEVLIIASTETYINNTELGYIEPGSYVTEYGVPIVRVPYQKLLTQYASVKIRKYLGVYELIDKFGPDVILFHGCCAYELLTVARYVKNHPSVKLYVDSHEDVNNSARNFISKYVLHKLFYRSVLKKALPYIKKVFYITRESKNFLNQIYKLEDGILEYFPLGGYIVTENERKAKRDKIRALLELKEDDLLLVHSGKMDKAKRTEEIVKAISEIQNENIKLVIIGSMTEDVKSSLQYNLDNDHRIEFIGWKSAGELLEYLCACDLYIQPRGQSATMQIVISCGTAVALYPHESHKALLGKSAFYIDGADDIRNLLLQIINKPDLLEEKRLELYAIACELLDYKKLAARLYR